MFLRKLFLLALALCLFLTACNLPGGSSTPASLPPATETTAPPPASVTVVPSSVPLPPTAAPALTIEQLKNAQYDFTGSDQVSRTFTLKDGVYQEGSDPAQLGYVSIVTGQQFAFGDLDQDGVEDAAILLAENYGGTGVFVSVVAVLNRDGQPFVAGSAPVDDRPIINALTIRDGQILLDAIVHGPGDPGCCAALPNKRTFILTSGGLLLTHLTSAHGQGAEHDIHITSPAPNAEVSGILQLKGEMPIGPFENNLAYRLYDAISGEQLAEGPFMVQSDGMGGPATFDNPIDISNIPPGALLRVQLLELSMADGSSMALDTLFVTVK